MSASDLDLVIKSRITPPAGGGGMGKGKARIGGMGEGVEEDWGDGGWGRRGLGDGRRAGGRRGAIGRREREKEIGG